MFGPGHNTRLGSALTQQLYLQDSANPDSELSADVINSWCAIELENESGQTITVQRAVTHQSIQTSLVRVWQGATLTSTSASLAGRSTDYFVRLPGAAKNERGFHVLLAEFFGWQLPSVPRYNGSDVPLYMELVAPFLYVDQRAWGSSSPRTVTHYQIREPTRRTVEFLLGFSGPEAQARRYALENSIAELRSTWSSVRQAAFAAASMAGSRLIGVPDLPAGARGGGRRPVEPTNLSGANIEVLENRQWKSLEEVLEVLRTQERPQEPVIEQQLAAPTVSDLGLQALTQQLAEAERELADNLNTARAVEQNLTLNEGQLVALDRRIGALEEEKSRNQDIKTLIRIGSAHPTHHLADSDCPTCHQSLAAVEAASVGPVLDVEETLGLLNAQLATARGMREQAVETVGQAQNAYAALQRAADAARTRIRALRADLTSPADYPSSSIIARQITAETRIRELSRAAASVQESVVRLQEIANAIAIARNELTALPSGLPEEDQQKLEKLTALLHEQLNEYGFSSYEADRIILDGETFRPERAGYDIDSDVSSTDVVRTKIAYLNAIRELADEIRSPHPGLLLLDEPRQHELDEDNFRSTLSRLGGGASGDQIIVTSAASPEVLNQLLGDQDVNIVDLGGRRLLQFDSTDDPLDFPPG